MCGEHGNSSESTGTIIINLTGGCKTATVGPHDGPSRPEKEFDHRLTQSAHYVDVDGCHTVTQQWHMVGMDFPHLKLDQFKHSTVQFKH